jgi:hypothetical protein
MGVGQASVAAATAVLGHDLANGQIFQQQSVDRALTGFAITGSAAAGDTKVDLYIDTVKIGEFFNTTTGFPTQDHLVKLAGNFIPSGAQIHCYVTDAPATNPINIMLTWDDVEE